MRTLFVMLLAAGAASADPRCVQVMFKPVPQLQIAVWIEDAQGNYVDTAYVTRLTGFFGLANRPGHHLLGSDIRFPYCRRDMVMPVWAHKRNHTYPLVVMGGFYGNSEASCAAHGVAAGECDDNTVAYHSAVSSPELFYCSPRGGVISQVNGMDAVSCASAFTGSKGAFADTPLVSYYPPRADLNSFLAMSDAPEAPMFASLNDLTAVSGATPAGNALITPIQWMPPADGQYVLKVEASMEADFNAFHNHPYQHDEISMWDSGHNIFGQPSIVWAVPFTVGPQLDIETTATYVGYGDWDGASGTMHPADSTISDSPGTGAGRFLSNSDDQGTWRIKVVSDPGCGVNPTDGGTDGMACAPPPGAPTGLTITSIHSSAFELAFASATDGAPTARFDVRYSQSPITDESFLRAIPSSDAAPTPGAPGSTVKTMLSQLQPEHRYYVAVRAIASCGAASPIATVEGTTSKSQFATLHGCFIATAAYGTPLAKEIEVLRRFRDRRLLPSPLGQLAVAAYYSFSPPIAGALTTDERLRAGARKWVEPLVRAASRLR
jgi:Fibronectin type III domain